MNGPSSSNRHTKATKRGSSRSILALLPWCRRILIACRRGNTTEMYKRRNEIERLFRRLKGFRRISSRFEKLDLMFTALINFALIADGPRIV